MRRGVPLRSAEGQRLVNRGPAWREHPDYYRDEPEEDEMECADPLAPPRGPLSPEVEAATRLISRELWGEPYRLGRGLMHHAGGPYWHHELHRKADYYERLAAAMRVCAEALPRA